MIWYDMICCFLVNAQIRRANICRLGTHYNYSYLSVMFRSTLMMVNGEQSATTLGVQMIWKLLMFHVDNLVLPQLLDFRTSDEGRVRYGCIICSVQAQKPHLVTVLTMDGELLGLTATVTPKMWCQVLKLIICGLRIAIMHWNGRSESNIPSIWCRLINADFKIAFKSLNWNHCCYPGNKEASNFTSYIPVYFVLFYLSNY